MYSFLNGTQCLDCTSMHQNMEATEHGSYDINHMLTPRWWLQPDGVCNACNSTFRLPPPPVVEPTTPCPALHPWAYRPLNGFDYCCATPEGGHSEPERINMGPRQFRSKQCGGNQFIKCADPPCKDYSAGYVFGPSGSNKCVGGMATANRLECKAAIQYLTNMTAADVTSSNWNHVPYGCSVTVDIRPHWCTNTNGNGNGGFPLVCHVPHATPPPANASDTAAAALLFQLASTPAHAEKVCVASVTAVVDKGGSGCSSSNRCTACEGDCDSDSDCATGLACFQRNSASDMVPGCAATGYVKSSSDHDYCYETNIADQGYRSFRDCSEACMLTPGCQYFQFGLPRIQSAGTKQVCSLPSGSDDNMICSCALYTNTTTCAQVQVDARYSVYPRYNATALLALTANASACDTTQLNECGFGKRWRRSIEYYTAP